MQDGGVRIEGWGRVRPTTFLSLRMTVWSFCALPPLHFSPLLHYFCPEFLVGGERIQAPRDLSVSSYCLIIRLHCGSALTRSYTWHTNSQKARSRGQKPNTSPRISVAPQQKILGCHDGIGPGEEWACHVTPCCASTSEMFLRVAVSAEINTENEPRD